MPAQTLYDKIWQSHIIKDLGYNNSLIYIDRHLIHEVTSPQAFDGLRLAKRKVRRPELSLVVCDHGVPTRNRDALIADEESRLQVDTVRKNSRDFGLQFFDIQDNRQGIVHVVGPEQGFTLPGLVIVCGDSHTATHGAFASLAFGIGTSEVEHVLATQSLVQKKSKNMLISINGKLAPGVGAKDVILTIIGKIGTAGGTNHVIEYTGDVIKSCSIEERMTICNMSIEAGAKSGLIAADQKTIDYLHGLPFAPSGNAWEQAVKSWKNLHSDENACFDKTVSIDAISIAPLVTWGTSPEDVVAIDNMVPNPENEMNPSKQSSMKRALEYMALKPDVPIAGTKIDKVFIGSCTNGRINDLRKVASIVKGHHVAEHVEAIIVPGSGLVKAQAEAEGLHLIFLESGFQWRYAGCSMCLGMNDDQLSPGERCATTSNRNFEGRQGKDGRSHLMSPPMAAVAAITGKLTDIRNFK